MTEARCPYHDRKTAAGWAVTYRHQGVEYVDQVCDAHLPTLKACLEACEGVRLLGERDIAQLELPLTQGVAS